MRISDWIQTCALPICARAVIVFPDRGESRRDAEARLDETAGLALAIGIVVADRVALKLRAPKPATLLGSRQVEALATTARMEEADLVIFDAALTPIQQRNLETALEAKVIDRPGLLLEIFGERAAPADGRPQAKLAHPKYPPGRRAGGGTHIK